MNFVNRPKTILLSFLKAFFSQEKLFNNLKNEFIYIDNVANDSLIIRTSYATFDENINAFPCIVLQEGGFQEEMRAFDNRNTNDLFGYNQAHISSFVHPVTLHCLAANKGTAETLQALAAKAIITFRKGIYQLGIDHITTLNGMPPQKISNSGEATAQYFDAAFTFSIFSQQNWIFDHIEDPEESIKISLISALNELEYDDSGNIISDSEEYFSQNVKFDL